MAKDTKKRIMNEALKLFANDGYEAVSVQNIADTLNITKGALYRHYKNKRDILDNIVDYMEEVELNRVKQYEITETEKEALSEDYKRAAFEKIIKFVADEFEYWTQDEFASNFRKMIILEQYRNWEMSALYHNYIAGGVVNYLSDYLWGIMRYASSDFDPRLVALELYSPVFLLMSMYDVGQDKLDAKELLKVHVESFIRKYEEYIVGK